jgi:aspartate aminotransferase
MEPIISEHFRNRQPSAIRQAQIAYSKRQDSVKAINTAIGNVTLPMHPSMRKRMDELNIDSPFTKGVVKYTPTVGLEETNQAFLNILKSSGFSTEGLFSQVTAGGSHAMELMILGCCGPAGSDERPLLLIDAAYTNYVAMAKRLGRMIISVQRNLDESGKFSMTDLEEVKSVIEKEKPSAIVVIPYDNPTGHFYDHKSLVEIGKLAVSHNLWLVSDEAYRELHYTEHDVSSVWGLTEEEVPGITGRRISIETASKVWNACGLRIGALITDNEAYHKSSVAEDTANLCTNAIGQFIFGAIAHESAEDLQIWYKKQRDYYYPILSGVVNNLRAKFPGIIVSNPDASLYCVVDVRNIVPEGFDSMEFVMWCAETGKVEISGEEMTLLVSPMAGFYNVIDNNPGKTQMRIAAVASPEEMQKVPELFVKLLEEYLKELL